MISKLFLFDFRNYSKRHFEFLEKNVVFYGPNGRGKTNILEALSLLSVGRSWRETSPKDLILYGQESAKITSETSRKDIYTVKIQPRSRIFEKNEKRIPLKKHFGQIATLLFVPEYLNLFSGTKQNRQRFFDRFLFQISPIYRDVLSRFNRATKQKNALLKGYDSKLFNATQLQQHLSPWNDILAETIPQIIQSRKDFLSELNPLLQQELSSIAHDSDSIVIELDIKEDFESTLSGVQQFFEKNMEREIAARKCIIGAHRDDFSFVFRDKPILSSASRGEERSVLLALLSAQKKMLKEKLQTNPILLLDDVFSELDQSRQDYLENLCDESQIFFTTTHQSHFENFSHPVQKFEIR